MNDDEAREIKTIGDSIKGGTIQDLFGKVKPVSVLRSQRDSIVYDFLTHLNDQIAKENLDKYRKAKVQNPALTKDEFRKIKGIDGYHTPIKASFIAFKMSHLSIQDMHYLWSICTKSKNFSRTWWGALKPRPEDKVVHRRG